MNAYQPPIEVTAKEVSEIQHSSFLQKCFELDSRFRFAPLGIYGDEKFFAIDKDIIHFPTEIPMVVHEVAHAVEMNNPKRWVLPDWGFEEVSVSFKKMKRNTNILVAAASRELRVRTIATFIPGKWDSPRPFSLENTPLAECFFTHPFWGDEVKKRLPFGRFRNESDYKEWVYDLSDKTYKAWSLDRIEHEWKIRVTAMQEHMEKLN